MSQLRVRRMEQPDIPAAVEIEQQVFPSPWTEKVFYRQLLNPGRRRLLVAELDGEVIGHLGAWLRARHVHITTLAVARAHRRRGVATALVEEIISSQKELRREVRLEVRKSNTVAQKLYRNLGFQEVDRKEDYYVDNQETALVMSYPLSPAAEADSSANTGRTTGDR